jgi:hypothetical protein
MSQRSQYAIVRVVRKKQPLVTWLRSFYDWWHRIVWIEQRNHSATLISAFYRKWIRWKGKCGLVYLFIGSLFYFSQCDNHLFDKNNATNRIGNELSVHWMFNFLSPVWSICDFAALDVSFLGDVYLHCFEGSLSVCLYLLSVCVICYRTSHNLIILLFFSIWSSEAYISDLYEYRYTVSFRSCPFSFIFLSPFLCFLTKVTHIKKAMIIIVLSYNHMIIED